MLSTVAVVNISSHIVPLFYLRANVTNGQTFGGNSSKINSAHVDLNVKQINA